MAAWWIVPFILSMLCFAVVYSDRTNATVAIAGVILLAASFVSGAVLSVCDTIRKELGMRLPLTRAERMMSDYEKQKDG